MSGSCADTEADRVLPGKRLLSMPRIFWIEDDTTYAAILGRRLERAGFELQTANNGEDGLKRIMADPPDLVLLDIGLPGKDGFQVLEELKADLAMSRIPVVMLSRLSSREDVERCQRSGCAEYLIKTQHDPEELVRHLKRMLQ